MNFLNYLQELSKSEMITAAGLIIALLLFVAGAVEKLFDKKYIGSAFCRLVWRTLKSIWNWARGEKLNQIKLSLEIIQKEVTPNGGGSMKDIMGELKHRYQESWELMMCQHDFLKELSIRMDIADEKANRMSFKFSADGSCIYVSENFLRFFAYTPNDVLGSRVDFCISPQQVRAVRLKRKTAFEQHKAYYSEQIIIDSDSNRHLCLERGVPLINKDGIFTGVFVSVEVLESLDD